MADANLRVFISSTFDPWFNLATEDWIFREMDPSSHTLFLWRNEDTVVIGRCQNPWTECNLEKMESDGVKLARRQSGGGAVFHDLGNTNFTFLSGKEHYHKEVNVGIIVRAIQRFGVQAYPSGRNDILVDGKKVSGSAFKEMHDRAFQHGTLLIRANLTRLSQYLTPGRKKLESRGIASVKSRVANLADFNPEITHENLSHAIIAEFFQCYQSSCEVETLDHQALKDIPSLYEYYEKLKDWNWRFGVSPRFNHQMSEKFAWGTVDVYINTNKGIMEEVNIYSDCLFPEMIASLERALKGLRYGGQDVMAAIDQLKIQTPEFADNFQDICAWMTAEMPPP